MNIVDNIDEMGGGGLKEYFQPIVSTTQDRCKQAVLF